MTRALLAAGLVALAGAGQAAALQTGRLTGRTLISFGCPGPVREGEPGCNPWRPFSGARFLVGGRVVVSDTEGRFALALRPGTYVVTALPQPHARGGTRLVVRIRGGVATAIVLRFDGYPKMV